MNEDFHQALEDMFNEGNDYLTAKTRDRPYDGQSHTDAGERGMQEVYGLTMRDIRDCFVMGMFQACGFTGRSLYEGTIYDLPLEDADPGAIIRNAVCEVENRMGIFPNLPGHEPYDRNQWDE